MAQTLYYGGTILTMREEGEQAEAVLTESGRIRYAGALAEADRQCESGCRRVDLKGRTMLPGFVDPHGHITMAAQFSAFADLSECTDFAQIVRKLERYGEEKGIREDGIILGYGYDHNFLKEGRHPDRALLDQVSGNVPVFVFHTSGHMGAANSALLNLSGITAETPDPAGGRIGRLPGSKEPNGYVEEASAVSLILRKIFERIRTDVPLQMEKAQQMYLENGITTVQDGATAADAMKMLVNTAERGAFKVDVVAYPLMTEDWKRMLSENEAYCGEYRNHLRIGGLKMILDGSPQGKSAWLTKPYEGETEYRGYPSLEDAQVEQFCRTAVEGGHQLLAHCNGDAASDQFIRCYRKAWRTAPEKELRPMMIHCQTVRKDQLAEMAKLRMIPSIFVAHVYYWGDVHLKNLGEERGRRISPVKSALEAGLPVNFHQDPPVVKPDMLHSVWCAVNRKTREGRQLAESECCSVYEALTAVTKNGAYAYFEEDRKGTIEAGKLADLVILSDSPMTVPKQEIKDIKVLATIKEGAAVYTRELAEP